MPSAPVPFCSHPGCSTRSRGLCRVHRSIRRQLTDAGRSSRHVRGYDSRWVRFVAAFPRLLLQRGIVPMCGARLSGVASPHSQCARDGRLTLEGLHLDHDPPLPRHRDRAAVCAGRDRPLGSVHRHPRGQGRRGNTSHGKSWPQKNRRARRASRRRRRARRAAASRATARPAKTPPSVIAPARALDLRIAGATYRQIGVQLGVSEKTAYLDVQEELGAARCAGEGARRAPARAGSASPRPAHRARSRAGIRRRRPARGHGGRAAHGAARAALRAGRADQDRGAGGRGARAGDDCDAARQGVSAWT